MVIHIVIHLENGVFNAAYASESEEEAKQHVIQPDDEWECLQLTLNTDTMEIG